MVADQTEPAAVAGEAVATLGVPVVADLTPVGVVVDRTTMARSNPTRLASIMALVTSSLSFLMSDSSTVFIFTFHFAKHSRQYFCLNYLDMIVKFWLLNK